jgi:hypothetical protein
VLEVEQAVVDRRGGQQEDLLGAGRPVDEIVKAAVTRRRPVAAGAQLAAAGAGVAGVAEVNGTSG